MTRSKKIFDLLRIFRILGSSDNRHLVRLIRSITATLMTRGGLAVKLAGGLAARLAVAVGLAVAARLAVAAFGVGSTHFFKNYFKR